MSATVWTNLGYADAPAALRFLAEVLGFEVAAVYQGADGNTIAHAELHWPEGGGVQIHTAPPGRRSLRNIAAQAASGGGYPAFSVHVDTKNPDAVYRRVQAAGAPIVREIADSPHGTRGFVVEDPEGLYWSIGTPLPPQVRSDGAWTASGSRRLP